MSERFQANIPHLRWTKSWHLRDLQWHDATLPYPSSPRGMVMTPPEATTVETWQCWAGFGKLLLAPRAPNWSALGPMEQRPCVFFGSIAWMSDTVFNVHFPGRWFRVSHPQPEAHVHSELFWKCLGDPGVRCCFKLLLAKRKTRGRRLRRKERSGGPKPSQESPFNAPNAQECVGGFWSSTVLRCSQLNWSSRFKASINSPWVLHSSLPNHLPTHCVTNDWASGTCVAEGLHQERKQAKARPSQNGSWSNQIW